MYDLTVIDQFMEPVIDQGQIYISTFDHPVAMVFVESWIPFVLKAFDCRSRGRAFVYLPLMMEATSAEGPQWGQVLERGYKKKKSRAKI